MVVCFSSQQDVGVSQGRKKTVRGVKIAVVVAVGDGGCCLTSQQDAGVSQG